MKLLIVVLLITGSATAQIRLRLIGSYATGVFNGSGTEISAFDPKTKRIFSTNVKNATLDIIDISDPHRPALFKAVSLTGYGAFANSVDVRDGVVAVAIENKVRTDPGVVAFFDTEGGFLASVPVGSLPDMLAFTPDGARVLVANEGEPSDDYKIDPEGSVSIIDITGGVRHLTASHVTSVGFGQFTRDNIDPRIRIFGPNATVAQDLEPEYLAISPDSKTAWVTLQENNAIGVLDIHNGVFTRLIALGFKDHLLPENSLDASDKDGAINLANWPVLGMYQPDGIAVYQVAGQNYLVTANEGDARDYKGFAEGARFEKLKLDPKAFPDGDVLKYHRALGRLNATKANGDADGDGKYEKVYVFGARSFSIWTDTGKLVFDSGNDFERITADALADSFNTTNSANFSFDTRSDDKGPEPEGVVVAKLFGKDYAFITLERIGGVMVYDVSNPAQPRFVRYVNERYFYQNAKGGTAGDLGPEGMFVIQAKDSPNGQPLLVVSNEVSGTVSIFLITEN